MQSIIDSLSGSYTCSVNKGNVVWKRGVRKADSIKSDIVYTYLLSTALQQHNSQLSIDLTTDRQKALDVITEWFKTEEDTAKGAAAEDEFDINEYIVKKFDKLFKFDEVTLQISLKGTIGNSYYSSTRAADMIMGFAEDELNNPPFGVDRVRRTVSQLILKTRERKRKDHLQTLVCTQRDDAFVDKWLRDLFDIYKIDPTDLNLTMYKHMLYSIKRAVWGYPPPACRFMYTMFARNQGIGKSQHVKHLADPFPYAFTDQGTLDMLLNKNDLKALTNDKLLIDIQELACEGTLDRAQYAAIKAAITSDTVGGRVLYSVESEEQPMLSVFVSSTNIHIADMIQDDTGLRRFFSFDFQCKRADMQWSKIDAHWKQIGSVYKAIDESGDPPLNDKMPVFAELELVQEDYKRRTDFIVEWQSFTGNKICDRQNNQTQVIKKTELFLLLGAYCKQFESFNLKMGTMRNLLISRHGIFPKTDAQGNEFYYITYGNATQPNTVEIATWSRPAQSPAIGSIL